MKTTVELPADAARWLRSVNRRLGALASGQRAEIVDGLRAHLVEAIADGEASADVLAGLGNPADVARTAIVESGEGSEAVRLPRYLTAKRILQILAFLLVLVGCVAYLHSEGTVSEFGPDPSSQGDPMVPILLSTHQENLLQLGGFAILGFVTLFVVVAGAPLPIRGKAWQPVSIASAVVLALPALVLGWSILNFFIPAAAASIVAVFLPPRRLRA
jgi:hypothetical protein